MARNDCMDVREVQHQGDHIGGIANQGGILHIHGPVNINGPSNSPDPSRHGDPAPLPRVPASGLSARQNRPGGIIAPGRVRRPPPSSIPGGTIKNIPFSKTIATTYTAERGFHIYFQEDSIIYETCCKKEKWSIPERLSEISDARPNTQLAVVSQTGNSKINLFYITVQNTIHERCWSSGKGWQVGSLDKKAFEVSAFSRLSALSLANEIRLFCQRWRPFALLRCIGFANAVLTGGDTICEHTYTFIRNSWGDSVEVGKALKGTSIAATSYPGHDSPMYHIYVQSPDLTLQEYVRNKEPIWKSGELPRIEARPYTPLAALAWYRDGPVLRLYSVSKDNNLWEHLKEGYSAKYKHNLNFSVSMEENIGIGAAEKDDGNYTRIYHFMDKGKLKTIALRWGKRNPTTKITLLP